MNERLTYMKNIKKRLFVRLSFVLALCISGIFIFSTDNSEKVKTERTGYMDNYNIYAVKIPDYIEFAGERAPVERWFVKEALDREMLVNTYWQSQTLLLIKRANKYFPLMERILREEELPDDFKYLALIESGLIPTAKSPTGATGMWQFIKSAAKEYGLEVNAEVDERYHIEKSTRAACQYLKKAKQRFGNWTLAAASYNYGMAGVARQMERQKSANYYDMLFKPETARYIYRILALKTILQKPSEYGFKYLDEDLYYAIPTYQVKVDTQVKDLADFAEDHEINYYVLKIFNPWLRDNMLTNKSGKTYYVTLPESSYANFDYSEYKKDKN